MNRDDFDKLRRGVDAIVGLLTDWSDWQKGYRMKLGYPTRSCGLASDASSSFEDMCDSVDNETMRVTDAVIQDPAILTPAQRAAVMKRYGVAAVFRFPRDNYEQCLLAAHERLLVELPRKGVMVL